MGLLCFLFRDANPNGDLLSALAQRGIFDVGTFPGGYLTDDGILEFAFGAYNDSETKRCMKIDGSQTLKLSPEFLVKLEKVSIEEAFCHMNILDKPFISICPAYLKMELVGIDAVIAL
jgi:hypothetical protein